MTDKAKNFWIRVATAVVALPLVLWLLWMGGGYFAALVAFACAASAFEFTALTTPGDPGWRGWVAEILAAGFPLLALWRGELMLPWVVLIIYYALGSQVFAPEPIAEAPSRMGRALIGPLYGGLLLSLLVLLRGMPFGVEWVGLCFILTWGNDTGAYFAGHALGRHKMAPLVSPGKTWEGFAGGVLSSVAGALIARALFLPALSILDCIALGAGAAALGPLGDLSESLLKRAVGAKDSGKILPGHGGMLDRIDALLFTAPLVYFYARFGM